MSGESPDAALLQVRILVIVVGRGRLDVLDERLHIRTLHGTASRVIREDGDVRRRGLPRSSLDRKSTRLNSSHSGESRMPSSA